MKVQPYTDSPESLARYSRIFLRDGSLEPRLFNIERVYPQRNILVLKLQDVETIDQAEPLIGFHICVPRDALEETDEDEYYWHDLIGLRITDETGNELGELKSIVPTGANDVYVIEKEKRELLLPATEDVILEVDLRRKVMVVKLPEII